VLASSLTYATHSTIGRVSPTPDGFRGREHSSDDSPQHLLDKLGIVSYSYRTSPARLLEHPKTPDRPKIGAGLLDPIRPTTDRMKAIKADFTRKRGSSGSTVRKFGID
jgi:hypothetical protein